MGTTHSQKIRRWSTGGEWLSGCMVCQGRRGKDQDSIGESPPSKPSETSTWNHL